MSSCRNASSLSRTPMPDTYGALLRHSAQGEWVAQLKLAHVYAQRRLASQPENHEMGICLSPPAVRRTALDRNVSSGRLIT